VELTGTAPPAEMHIRVVRPALDSADVHLADEFAPCRRSYRHD
jgi:hypothetical protein